MTASARRFVSVPGMHNLRDLGPLAAAGGTLPSGLLFRSEAPVDLSQPGIAVLDSLHLRTAIDLREPIERAQAPAVFSPAGPEVHAVPVFAKSFDVAATDSLGSIYDAVLRNCGTNLARAITLLGAPDALPAVFFCTAGKDRTGILSALLLATVGVSEQTILDDYELTATVLHGEFMDTVVARASAAGLRSQRTAVRTGSPSGVMSRLLEQLRLQGGETAYLLRHGVPADAIARLQGIVTPGSSRS